jgi:hypothetical protein
MAVRTVTYIDFAEGKIKSFETGDTISPEVVQGVVPANYVVMNTTNTDPATDLGWGTWSYLGSQTIGVTTVYYYENVPS